MKLNVFGRRVEAVREQRGWRVYYLGNEGKRRPADDIIVPADIEEADLIEYLSDLCHEWATPARNEVTALD